MEVINFLENKMLSGGREAFVANACMGMKENGIKYIVLVNWRTENIYEGQIKRNGGEIVYLKPKKTDYLRRFWTFSQYARRHRYAIWWFHVCATSMYHYVFLARICGAKKIVYHVHNISYTKPQSKAANLRDRLLNWVFRRIPKERVACSEQAGRSLFKKDSFTVVHNGIEAERFHFNQKRRNLIRKKWKMGERFVIGQVGRLAFPKNQIFTLSVIRACIDRGISCEGVLVGEGEDRKEIDKYILQQGLSNYIRIVPSSESVEYFYQGFDLLMFPSLYEGLGIVALEAQASGLPVLCSQSIPSAVCVTDHIWKLDLNNMEAWVEKIEELQSTERDREGLSKSGVAACANAGFSIERTRSELLDLYRILENVTDGEMIC